MINRRKISNCWKYQIFCKERLKKEYVQVMSDYIIPRDLYLQRCTNSGLSNINVTPFTNRLYILELLSSKYNSSSSSLKLPFIGVVKSFNPDKHKSCTIITINNRRV